MNLVCFCVCFHLAVVRCTCSPGQTALPSQVLASASDCGAPPPGDFQRRRSGGRDEVWSYTSLDLLLQICCFLLWFQGLQRRERSQWVSFCTLQHAVIGLPVHVSQSCPEVFRLWTFLYYLHLYRAALAEAQLWRTPKATHKNITILTS